MIENNTIPKTAVDPVCGKTFDPRKIQFTSNDGKGTHYFCSDACRRRYDTADTKTKKGFWERYTDRLKSTHSTQTPPDCR